MTKHIPVIVLTAALTSATPAFAQSPPPLDPDPGADLLYIVAHPAAAKLKVKTPGWKNGEDIPFPYTQYQGNHFPGLQWSKGPYATKSYAIIMQDTGSVYRGAAILHWSMLNISAKVTRLAAGMQPEEKPVDSFYGPNYMGANQPYLGPRTPAGPKHRYHLQVLALDTTLPADFAPKYYDELIAPLAGHVLAAGEVVGLGQIDPSAPPRPALPTKPAPAASN